MEEIKKLLETWKTEKGSFIPNAPIYGVFIKEFEDAIERQEQINKLTIPVVVFSEAELKAKLEEQKEEIRQWLIGEGFEGLAERL